MYEEFQHVDTSHVLQPSVKGSGVFHADTLNRVVLYCALSAEG